jgi:hypothetical protein
VGGAPAQIWASFVGLQTSRCRLRRAAGTDEIQITHIAKDLLRR